MRVGQTCLWALVVFLALVTALYVLARLRLVALPVLLAVVLATFLEPPAKWLRAHNWPAGLAAALVLLAAMVALAGVLAVVAPAVVDEFDQLDVGVSQSVDEIQAWIRESPLPVSNEQISDGIDKLEAQVRDSVDSLAARALGGAVLAAEVVTGLVLALVVLFFVLKDGARIWAWMVDLAPASRRRDLDVIGARAWDALGGYVRGQTLVALFDAILIGLALVIIGVPLALPLAVLTFFGAYVPVIGATVAGLLAVLIALVAQGPVAAGAVLAAIVVVQQLEGNLFQPVVVGRAIHVHPLAILLGVTAGGVLAGIIGAMVAGPAVAVGAAVLGHVREARSAG